MLLHLTSHQLCSVLRAAAVCADQQKAGCCQSKIWSPGGWTTLDLFPTQGGWSESQFAILHTYHGLKLDGREQIILRQHANQAAPNRVSRWGSRYFCFGLSTTSCALKESWGSGFKFSKLTMCLKSDVCRYLEQKCHWKNIVAVV